MDRERFPIEVKADPLGLDPVEIPKNTIWQQIEQGQIPGDKELQFRVNTRGDRKMERKVPSGLVLRIFRPGIAHQYTCRKTGKRDTELFRLQARDALALFKDPTVKIQFEREHYDLGEGAEAVAPRGETPENEVES